MFVVFHNQCCMCVIPFFVIAQDVRGTARPRNSFVQSVYDKYTLTLVLAQASELLAILQTRDPFLESPGNFSGPKLNIQTKR